MHLRQTILIATAVVSLAAAGCTGKSGEGEKKASSTGQVLAEVDGTTITTDDFKKELENLPPYLKPMTETPEGKKELLETMVIRELILQQAKKDGIENTKAVADKLAELKKRVVVDAYLKKKVEEQAQLTDAELQKFYEQNKDKFKTGPEIHASHILVKPDQEQLAKDILAQLKKGASFEELAKKYSVDAAGQKGGDLGWFGRGSMIPEFENAAFALKEGETSGIIKTKFGYHIIKVTGKRPAGIRPFPEVKDQIKAAMEPEKQQEVFKKLKDDLKKSSKYTIKEDVLKNIDSKGNPVTPAPGTKSPEGKTPETKAPEKSPAPAGTPATK